MKIKSVEAFWVHIPIPHERQHTSDFGRTTSFDGTLVRIDFEWLSGMLAGLGVNATAESVTSLRSSS